MKTVIDARKAGQLEVHDLMSRLAGLSAVGVNLRPKESGGTLSAMILGDISVQVLRSAPMLMLADALPGRTTLLKVMDGAERARWNGEPPASRGVFVCDSSRQHEAIYPDDFACLLVSFGAAANDDIAAGPTLADAQASRAGDGRDSRWALLELDRISHTLEDGPAGPPKLLADTETARGLRASILEAADAILASSKPAARHAARSPRARQRLVHAADDYLRANPARPVYTEELCTVLCASATGLHHAFQLTFGMSPHRYLKLRRMGMVRAMLLSRSVPWHSVKAAALSHGFWHLGQFAHDYRDVYGELPSETLARARATDDRNFDLDMDWG